MINFTNFDNFTHYLIIQFLYCRTGQTSPSSDSNHRLDWDKPLVEAREKIMFQGWVATINKMTNLIHVNMRYHVILIFIFYLKLQITDVFFLFQIYLQVIMAFCILKYDIFAKYYKISDCWLHSVIYYVFKMCSIGTGAKGLMSCLFCFHHCYVNLSSWLLFVLMKLWNHFLFYLFYPRFWCI